MGLFGNKNKGKKLSFAFGGYSFSSDDQFISYKSAYGKFFRVPKKDIETVSLDKGKAGKYLLKVVGKGSILAELELPKSWAEKAQEFIMDEVTT